MDELKERLPGLLKAMDEAMVDFNAIKTTLEHLCKEAGLELPEGLETWRNIPR